jgi:hypothetical protein
MSHCLFTLPLVNQNDLVRVRQLVRHATSLLAFAPADRVALVAAAFDLACQAWAQTGEATLCCEIADDCLHVACTTATDCISKKPETSSVFRLCKPLPTAKAVARDDLPWMLQQLLDLTPLDLFEEMKALNLELLQVLIDQARQRGTQIDYAGPDAA